MSQEGPRGGDQVHGGVTEGAGGHQPHLIVGGGPSSPGLACLCVLDAVSSL